MKIKLLIRGILAIIGGVVMVMLPLYLSAGTVDYPHMWLMAAVLFIPMLLMGIVMFVKAPDLLEKRLKNKETEDTQKTVILLAFFMFMAGFCACGIDYRFDGASVPWSISVVSAVAFLVGYGMYAEVLRENAYLSRVIEVQDGQKLIDTGLYAVVRHPMYTATVLMFCTMPLVLGSLWGFVIFLVYPFILVGRIKNEEKVLAEGLEGYTNYIKRVRYRMIPFIW